MGQLIIPTGGVVYIETPCLIYTVERNVDFYPMLVPLWSAAQSGTITLVTSELSILECLVGPFKTGDARVLAGYEAIFRVRDLQLLPVDEPILREAARLRATTNLKTPDAIHAATALAANSSAMITNDIHFKDVPGLAVQVLSQL